MALKHDKPYRLGMASFGPSSNGSQFYITLDETPWLDGKHVIFGKLCNGKNVLDKIVEIGSYLNDSPKKIISIEKCLVTRR